LGVSSEALQVVLPVQHWKQSLKKEALIGMQSRQVPWAAA
jgi:hypothetical protein